MKNAYHFITHWHVPAPPEEVYTLLEDVHALAKWWPSVYLDVRILDKGQPGGVGKVVDLYTKGWLPYTLRWKFVVTETNYPTGYTLRAEGDFEGTGVWTFQPNEAGTLATYDWNIEAKKPILQKLSWLLKPIFSRNHSWAMEKGEESLLLELRRRKGEKQVPGPPGPTFPNNFLNNRLLQVSKMTQL